MATFSTWDALITEIKNQIQTYVETGNCSLRSIEIGGHKQENFSPKQLGDLLQWAIRMKNLEDVGGHHSSITSYGRHRRFR